ncbi:hypothetical protein [Spongiactinospora rosea]|uniref:hypothetical protein n=1 Tax=Spongiactinospora rosea TaxID=2248750 RepID=UPI0011C06280|nr:hypothetical protein [Spongiactinospora rosea]
MAGPVRLGRRGRTLGALAGTLALVGALLSAAPAAAEDLEEHLCDSGSRDDVLLQFRTGADDLRGDNWWGDSNLAITVVSRVRPAFRVENVNRGKNWGGGETSSVRICLNRHGFTAAEVSGLRLEVVNDPFGVFDNWNLDHLNTSVRSFTLGEWQRVRESTRTGAPLHRFDGDRPTFDVQVEDLFNGGFEFGSQPVITAPWFGEGPDWKGVDVGIGHMLTGRNNAFTWSTGRNWNAILQTVPVRPDTPYVLTGWIRTSDKVNTGFFGARLAGIWPPPGEVHFGPHKGVYTEVTSRFRTRNHTQATVFAGLWGVGTPGGDWIQLDEVELRVDR